MHYAVTVEPDDRLAYPGMARLRSNVEARDKDAALSVAELSYRRQHPNVGKLRSRVMRVHPHG